MLSTLHLTIYKKTKKKKYPPHVRPHPATNAVRLGASSVFYDGRAAEATFVIFGPRKHTHTHRKGFS